MPGSARREKRPRERCIRKSNPGEARVLCPSARPEGSLTGLQFGGTRGGSGNVGGKKEEEEELAEEKRKKEEKKQRREKNRRLWYLETKAEEEFTRTLTVRCVHVGDERFSVRQA